MPADFYDLLDVAPDASAEEIKRAYREKAREYHPDVNADDRSGDQFKAVRTAYEVLSDASERKDYDRLGHRTYVEQRLGGLPGSNAGSSGGRSTSRSRQRGTSRSASRSRSTSSARSRSSGRSRSTARESSSSGSRSTWGERTISEPGARAKAMRAGRRVGFGPVLFLAAVGYLVGLATFLVPYADLFDAIGTAVVAGDVSAIRSLLLADGFADSLSFTARAVERASSGLLYPIGAVTFPVVLGAGASQSERAVWWIWIPLALGPLSGLALDATTVPTTVGVDLALYVVGPVLAVLGTAFVAISDR